MLSIHGSQCFLRCSVFGRDFEVHDTSKQNHNVYKHSLGFLITIYTGVYTNLEQLSLSYLPSRCGFLNAK